MASDRTPTEPDRDATVVSRPVTAPPSPEGARATRGAARDAVAAQRARFGGIKWGAAFFGWLSANGLAVILVSLLSAAGVALGLANGVDTADEAARQADTVGMGGAIAVLVVLFLAYLAGGYVAGRMARFDGARQGLATWLIGLIVVLLLAVAGAVLGAQYNVLQQLNLPRIPIDEGTATTGGIIALVAVLLVTLLGAVLGGKLGTRYHRRIDRAGYDA
jgi:MFS family permease